MEYVPPPERLPIEVTDRDTPLAITDSGTPDAYRAYDGRGATIDVRHQHDQ